MFTGLVATYFLSILTSHTKERYKLTAPTFFSLDPYWIQICKKNNADPHHCLDVRITWCGSRSQFFGFGSSLGVNLCFGHRLRIFYVKIYILFSEFCVRYVLVGSGSFRPGSELYFCCGSGSELSFCFGSAQNDADSTRSESAILRSIIHYEVYIRCFNILFAFSGIRNTVHIPTEVDSEAGRAGHQSSRWNLKWGLLFFIGFFVDPHCFFCGSESSLFSQCGSGYESRLKTWDISCANFLFYLYK